MMVAGSHPRNMTCLATSIHLHFISHKIKKLRDLERITSILTWDLTTFGDAQLKFAGESTPVAVHKCLALVCGAASSKMI